MKQQVSVSNRALVQRINRKLRPDCEALKKARPRWWNELGDYYIVDYNRNWIVAKDVDIEDLGRELGVLQPHETMGADADAR
jgi:hypothetical protein